MELTLQGIADKRKWEEKGYHLPQYDIKKMAEATKENPFWIHFGAGNLFRAFHANVVQGMLDRGELDRGLVVAEGFDPEIIEKMYMPHDNLGIAATLRADGTIEKTVVGSVAEALPLDQANEPAYDRLREIFRKKSLQMATFTITEKGYSLADGKGKILPDVAEDFAAGPEKPSSYMGKVASLLYARYQAGRLPIAMVSTDNCSHNGDKLYAAIQAFAKAWKENGRAEAGFLEYIHSHQVSFTWSMIDKITPRPDPSVEAILISKWAAGPDKGRAHVHGPEDGRPGGADEGVHLPEPAAHLPGGLWMPAGISEDFRGNAGSGIKAAGGKDRIPGGAAGGYRSGNPGSEGIYRYGAEGADPESIYAGYAPADRHRYLPEAGHPFWGDDQGICCF